MDIYQVEFLSFSNRFFIIKTTVKESSIEKAKSYACQWLAYWMGLKSTDFKIILISNTAKQATTQQLLSNKILDSIC